MRDKTSILISPRSQFSTTDLEQKSLRKEGEHYNITSSKDLSEQSIRESENCKPSTNVDRLAVPRVRIQGPPHPSSDCLDALLLQKLATLGLALLFNAER